MMHSPRWIPVPRLSLLSPRPAAVGMGGPGHLDAAAWMMQTSAATHPCPPQGPICLAPASKHNFIQTGKALTGSVRHLELQGGQGQQCHCEVTRQLQLALASTLASETLEGKKNPTKNPKPNLEKPCLCPAVYHNPPGRQVI